jgi:uncharacterized spore protein YtfJ
MNMDYEKLLLDVTEFIRSEASTETVVGKSFELGKYTCVPVIRVGMGFGTGGGEGTDPKKGSGQGGGAGAGVGIEPIGFLVTHGEEIAFVHTSKATGLSAAFEKVPDLIDHYLQQRAQENPAKKPVAEPA